MFGGQQNGYDQLTQLQQQQLAHEVSASPLFT